MTSVPRIRDLYNSPRAIIIEVFIFCAILFCIAAFVWYLVYRASAEDGKYWICAELFAGCLVVFLSLRKRTWV